VGGLTVYTPSKLARSVAMLAALTGAVASCNYVLGLNKLSDGCVVTECPAPETACQVAICAGTTCGVANAPAGTVVPGQAAAACTAQVCDGNGAAQPQDLPAGTVVPGQAAGTCTQKVCDGMGSIQPRDVATGMACSTDAGAGVCNDGGACVGCNDSTQCDGGSCAAGQCVAASCSDGVKDGDETAADCGGSCQPCTDGMACGKSTDCTGGTCAMGACCTPKSCATLGLTCGNASDGCGGTLNCNDGVRNGNETDVDCGGMGDVDAGVGACPPCPQGDACAVNADCTTVQCAGSVTKVCCDMACAGVCVSCDLSGAVGTCTPVPQLQMAPGCDHKAGMDNACDGDGNCKLSPGAFCQMNSQCASHVCSGSPLQCQ
jgi:hypothetical protein